jgi:PAS domain S-box-containing protein
MRRPGTSRRVWAAIVVLVLALSAGGFVLARAIVRHDQRAAAARRADSDRVRTEILLERAKNDLTGLGELLAGEPSARPQRFAFLAETTITSFDLVDALWIQRGQGGLRVRYATTVAPGTDVSGWQALVAPIAHEGTVFAATATAVGSLHGLRGFWIMQSGRFGVGPGNGGYLALFVPQGWVTLSLQDDPRQVEVALDGQHLEGRAAGSTVGTTQFQSLDQTWRIRVDAPAETSLETILPWLALAWPWAAFLVAGLIGNALARRRRAEHEVERIFDLSLDLLGVASYDGHFIHVNPAFTRTLGYTAEELTSAPLVEFVVEEDRASTQEAFARLLQGEEIVQFENRYRRRDGSACWMEWSVRPVPRERLLYAAARDITARRHAEEQVRRTEAVLRASRDELRQLADEHAAVRRVATLVARGVAPQDVFEAVAREVRALLTADTAVLLRYEGEDMAALVAIDSQSGLKIESGRPRPLPAGGLASRVRTLDVSSTPGSPSVCHGDPDPELKAQGLRSGTAVAVVVEGVVWGALEVFWQQTREASAAAAGRLRSFSELVATAIANAHSRGELTASRARVVAAGDEARRRIERDLHDGTQQRLVALALALRIAESQVPTELESLRARIGETAEGLAAAVADLQEFSRGIHPAILSRGGLVPALRALARRSAVPVELETEIEGRLDSQTEVAAYYLVSEALTNAAKHAQASLITVRAAVVGQTLEVTIADDGVGGADRSRGTGLVGLLDRVQAIGGTLEILSTVGAGTTLRAAFPLSQDEAPTPSPEPVPIGESARTGGSG